MTHTIGFAAELLVGGGLAAAVVMAWCLSEGVAGAYADDYLAFRYGREAFIVAVTVLVTAEAVLLYGIVVLGRGGHGGPPAETLVAMVAFVAAFTILVAVFAAVRIIGWRLVYGWRQGVPT